MNAYELADCLEELCRESQGSFTKDAYIMLRQQADEIQALKDGFNTAWGGTNNSELAEVRAMANRMVLKVKEQAEKIKNMEIWEKKYLDRIEGLEAERDYIKREWLGGLVKIAVLEKTQELKELSDEEIIEIGNAVVNLIDSNEGWIEFARAILKKASEK
jgi:predicted ATPase